MSNSRVDRRGARSKKRRTPGFEPLEGRHLLAAATEASNAPSLAGLIAQAHAGRNTAQAAINTMVQALQAQLKTGPLADLQAGTVNGTDFLTEVQSLETSFAQNVDQQLLPEFPNVANLIKLQGTRIVADLTSLNQQATVGVLTSSQLPTSAASAIDQLTSGSLKPLHTPLRAFVGRTQSFEADLNTLAQSLATGATTPLTISQVSTTLNAEAAAYSADVAGSLYLHSNVNQLVQSAVTTLENTVSTIAQSGATDAQTQVQAAITAFDTAVLDTTGVFGPQGIVSQHHRKD